MGLRSEDVEERSREGVIEVVGIVPKMRSSRAMALAREIARKLEAQGIFIYVEEGAGDALADIPALPGQDMCQVADLVLVLGGDGTLLHAASLVKDGTPILGINAGHLGFMTEIKAEEVDAVLATIVEGSFVTSRRTRLVVEVEQEGVSTQEGIVLNDAVVNSSSGRTVRLRVTLDGNFVTEVRADGLIVSTPTGSTAYNMAAGGPIMYPSLEGLVLTPICPQSLTHRSIVIPDHLTTEIHLTARGEAHLNLDGQKRVYLLPGAKVRVRRNGSPLHLIQSPFRDYFKILRAKLRWGSTVT